MELHEAFNAFIRKYYEGYEYAETTKINPRAGEYSFKNLDILHKEVVPKRKPVEPEPLPEDLEEEVIENDD